MTTPTCSTCRHWQHYGTRSFSAEGKPLGSVGTCALGGPTPEDGCSDCHAQETCEKHTPKEA